MSQIERDRIYKHRYRLDGYNVRQSETRVVGNYVMGEVKRETYGQLTERKCTV